MIALVGPRFFRDHFSVNEKDEASLANCFSSGFVGCLHSPHRRSLEVFLFSDFALVSQLKPFRDFHSRNSNERSAMKRIRSLAIAGLFVLSAAHATTITENFTGNPLQNGWQVFEASGRSSLWG